MWKKTILVTDDQTDGGRCLTGYTVSTVRIKWLSGINGQCVKLQALLLLQHSSSIQDTQSNAALVSAAMVCSD